jgi:hypothetical protein
MKINEMVEWLKVEFMPLMLATPDQTIEQIVHNAIRYFNNNSAVKYVEMVDATSLVKVPVPPSMKTVAQVYPAISAPTLNVQDFPLWTLLGIQVLDGLTTDLIMLMETYKNFMIYMGKDFHWSWLPADDPYGNHVLNEVQGTETTLSRQLANRTPVPGTLILTCGSETFTDAGDGTLVSDQSGGGTGTISATGVWAVTGWVDTGNVVASYDYAAGGWVFCENIPAGNQKLCVVGSRRIFEDDDVTHSYILDFLLRYSKALLKVTEGNILRKAAIINVANDGQELLGEGKEEIKELQAELRAGGRWLTFMVRT